MKLFWKWQIIFNIKIKLSPRNLWSGQTYIPHVLGRIQQFRALRCRFFFLISSKLVWFFEFHELQKLFWNLLTINVFWKRIELSFLKHIALNFFLILFIQLDLNFTFGFKIASLFALWTSGSLTPLCFFPGIFLCLAILDRSSKFFMPKPTSFEIFLSRFCRVCFFSLRKDIRNRWFLKNVGLYDLIKKDFYLLNKKQVLP